MHLRVKCIYSFGVLEIVSARVYKCIFGACMYTCIRVHM